MSASALLLRALVFGPARRHPARVLLPIAGVAVGVAAVASVHHANRSVTASFREAASSLSGRSAMVVTGPGGVPVEAIPALAFLWRHGSLAPAVIGTAVVGSPERIVVDLVGVDLPGDGAVRDIRIVDPAPETAARRLFEEPAVLLPLPLARRLGVAPGGRLRLIAGGVPREVAVAGVLEISGLARAAAGDVLVTDLFTAQILLGRRGWVDRVDVVLDEGVSKDAVERELQSRLPAGLTVEPPNRSAETSDRMVRAFRFNLNALGSLTVLVGAFLIANAVSIAVLRRRPEIATLRAIGASRGSIFAVFLFEGLVIGLAGTALGLAGGSLLARLALSAVAATVRGIYLPTARIASGGLSGALALAAAAGLLSALAATLLPAVEAARVEPAPAMRSGSIERRRRLALPGRTWAAAASLAVAALLLTLPPVDGFPLFGFASVGLVVVAIALLSAALVRGAGRLLSAPAARFGPAGRLAARFFSGEPARNGIAVTALTMALGMTIAMLVTVASMRATVRTWVETSIGADLFVQPRTGSRMAPVGDIPGEVIAFVSSIEGVDVVDPVSIREVTDRRGRPFSLFSGDFKVFARFGSSPLLGGGDANLLAVSARARQEVFVSEPYSRRFGVSAGDEAEVPTPEGFRRFRVAGVFRDFSNDRGAVVMDRDLYVRLFRDTRIDTLAVLARPGVDLGTLRRRILTAAEGRYALMLTTNAELRREVLVIFDRTFRVTRALEAIAVTVAILGIANALLASAVERRRAFGLLRAVGADAGQIEKATRLEALFIGAAGAAAALPAGAAFAAILLGVINPQSFGWTVSLSVPLLSIAAVTALVLAASAAAGVYPGRLAARTDPAAALAEE